MAYKKIPAFKEPYGARPASGFRPGKIPKRVYKPKHKCGHRVPYEMEFRSGNAIKMFYSDMAKRPCAACAGDEAVDAVIRWRDERDRMAELRRRKGLGNE